MNATYNLVSIFICSRLNTHNWRQHPQIHWTIDTQQEKCYRITWAFMHDCGLHSIHTHTHNNNEHLWNEHDFMHSNIVQCFE